VLAACAALVFLALLGLGSWQVWRMQWKHALIAQIDARVHAPAVPAPNRAHWAGVTAQADAYRHVSVKGVFLHERTVWVQASTVLGSGFWLITPLLGENGDIVLINRGYVPSRGAKQANPARPREESREENRTLGSPVNITGLLRISEKDGAFLRHNDAAGERWYSRDVEAIAAARHLGTVAPYFIDADAAQDHDAAHAAAPDDPVGGLTVIALQDNHLVYALTWFAMALMMAVAFIHNRRQGAFRG
jgi:surfeit locus 1 family protein